MRMQNDKNVPASTGVSIVLKGLSYRHWRMEQERSGSFKKDLQLAKLLCFLDGVAAKLDFGENEVAVQQWIAVAGLDEVCEGLVGKKCWQRATKLAAKHGFHFDLIRKGGVEADGPADSWKTWVETQEHGINEGSTLYVTEEDGKRRFRYDGDEDFAGEKPAEELSRSFVIPYARHPRDESIVGWRDNKSFCKLEVKAGSVKELNGFKTQAIYIARALPDTKFLLAQELLSEFYDNQSWDKFNTVLAAIRDYRKAAQERSLEDCRNGRKVVYFRKYKTFTLYSPVIWAELSDEVRAEFQARTDCWKIYQHRLGRLEAMVNDLNEIREALDQGVLVGDVESWELYVSMARRVADEVISVGPWHFKRLLKGHYDVLFGRSKVTDADIFGDDGDLLS